MVDFDIICFALMARGTESEGMGPDRELGVKRKTAIP